MKQRRGTQFNCFSPPIMVATLLIEFSLAAYTVWRYKLTTLTQLIAVTLVALGTFQVAEYFVCTGLGAHGVEWSRLGFVAITALPPLGLHILHEVAGKPNRRLVNTAYLSMIGFMTFFAFSQTAFVGHQCTGNYTIFQLGDRVGGFYTLYYYGWLATALSLGAYWSHQLIRRGKNLTRFQAVRGMMIGYLVFLVPTALVNTISPESRSGIPSIMCGFAVLFALILALYVLPRVAKPKPQPLRPLDNAG